MSITRSSVSVCINIAMCHSHFTPLCLIHPGIVLLCQSSMPVCLTCSNFVQGPLFDQPSLSFFLISFFRSFTFLSCVIQVNNVHLKYTVFPSQEKEKERQKAKTPSYVETNFRILVCVYLLIYKYRYQFYHKVALSHGISTQQHVSITFLFNASVSFKMKYTLYIQISVITLIFCILLTSLETIPLTGELQGKLSCRVDQTFIQNCRINRILHPVPVLGGRSV